MNADVRATLHLAVDEATSFAHMLGIVLAAMEDAGQPAEKAFARDVRILFTKMAAERELPTERAN